MKCRCLRCPIPVIAIVLTICTAQAAPPTAPGNFRICFTGSDDDFQESKIVIPPGIIFLSWGPLVGDLTNPGHDFAFDRSDQAKDHSAVITIYDVVLTKEQKCATTSVLVVLSKELRHPIVRKSDNLVFQAERHESLLADQLPDHLYDYLTMGVFYGAPIADIKYTKTLSE
jgi:hypothetical protein